MSELAQQQLEDLQTKENLTLYTDETTKRGFKFIVYAATTETKVTYVLGMKPIATKSAQDTLDTIISLVEEVSVTASVPNLGQRLIVNLKNTMSDRAGTEKLFNVILKDYRNNLLPEVVSGFEDLSDNRKDQIRHMNNYFCGLHLTVSLAEAFLQILRNLKQHCWTRQ